MSRIALGIALLAGLPLPGCLTRILWEGYGADHWVERSQRAELQVTHSGIGETGELVLGYRAPESLPAPFGALLGDAGWLTLAPDGGGEVAGDLLMGRSDLEVTSAVLELRARLPDPLGMGIRATLSLEGVVGHGCIRVVTGDALKGVLASVEENATDPPPELVSCIVGLQQVHRKSLLAAAGLAIALEGAWEVLGWRPRDEVASTIAASEPATLADFELLVRGAAGTGEGDVHLIVPADLMAQLRSVEYQRRPAPHFRHHSDWAVSAGSGVPLTLGPLVVRPTLFVEVRTSERVREDGFWDAAWRVVSTPFAVIADAAGLSVTVGAVVGLIALADDCDSDSWWGAPQ